ncbi:DUF190 domain-containing protein [Sinirhodobacter populi]|uniref:DUF190 domain-containing protein n=1 Tax=Paenirhodobacter populi TaxID=2306993 RepID=A0A443JYE1_9RHOB|nr:DUF190 domain-containing protein [Sinirhodobacter populi]RWR25501.1 DUF190 domain-containing protein [Sinirhodobacter populi]
MQGFQITFYTQQDRVHDNTPLAHWLLEEAKRIGIRGATLSGSIEGLGHDGQTHSASWFDFSDQPIQLTLIVTADEAEKVFSRIAQERIKIFYMKIPVEFGTLGEEVR